MPFDPYRHHRKSIRLRRYDYRQAGVYFITICTYERQCLFGEIANGAMCSNVYGRIVSEEWGGLSVHFPNLTTDISVLMPNHFHGILTIETPEDATCLGTASRAPTEAVAPQRQFGCPVSGSIPTVVGAFKAGVTRRINEERQTPGGVVWQRGFYDRIVRSETMLNAIRVYIINNPSNWTEDENYSDH